MSFSILADEGLNGNIVRELLNNGFDVKWVLLAQPGIKDEQVIKLAKESKSILITEDKDFGEWVFAHHVKGLSIIFLRYDKKDYPNVLSFLIAFLKNIAESTDYQEEEFITINRNKLRRRKI
ncbi:MAG: DUF5615 family PIN-like protein [Saprospiraceae bacterium]|nr:DUF5615 family PIN-like protein [Saprospiraceae bacterium]